MQKSQTKGRSATGTTGHKKAAAKSPAKENTDRELSSEELDAVAGGAGDVTITGGGQRKY